MLYFSHQIPYVGASYLMRHIFSEGVRNISIAFSREIAAQIPTLTQLPVTTPTSISFCQRVAHLGIGCLLCFPLLNVIIYIALGNLNIDTNANTNITSNVETPIISAHSAKKEDSIVITSEFSQSSPIDMQNLFLEYLNFDDLWLMTQVSKERREFIFNEYLQLSSSIISSIIAEMRSFHKHCLENGKINHTWCQVSIDKNGYLQTLQAPHSQPLFVAKEQNGSQPVHMFRLWMKSISWNPIKDKQYCVRSEFEKPDTPIKLLFFQKIITIRFNQLAQGAWNISRKKANPTKSKFVNLNKELIGRAKVIMWYSKDSWMYIMDKTVEYPDRDLFAAASRLQISA